MAARGAAEGGGGGRVRTYQPVLVNELVAEGRARSPGRFEAEAAESPTTAACNAWAARKAAQRAALAAKAQARAERYQAAQERRAAEDAAARDRRFAEVLGEVLAGIEGGAGVTAETQAVVDDANRSHAERREALYKEWHAAVFETIQSRIREATSRTSVAELEAALAAAADSYVAATNARPGGVYLDVVLPEEYDPLAPRRRAVKITTADIVDPVKRDLLKAQAERDLLRRPAAGGAPGAGAGRVGGGGSMARGGGGGSAGTLPAASRLAAAQTRSMLQTTKWGALQIRATPACHCINGEGRYAVRPPAPAALAMGASRVPMDDFGPPAPAPYRPSKHMGGGEARVDHIDDIIQWRYATGGPTTVGTGGDAWLEANGKRSIPAPGGGESGGRAF
ncbi:MAG: hypothetical protein J3K34DRAFT_259684 [Monoraphidium minutum]|nr:MAG: hypothetical protein J3K34DRAFT_259684 [Monoraphidium minutum]